MVEHSTADREVSGSNPDVPCVLPISVRGRDVKFNDKLPRHISRLIVNALAGNRTPVSRVAGENSTTEPPMLVLKENLILNILIALLLDLLAIAVWYNLCFRKN